METVAGRVQRGIDGVERVDAPAAFAVNAKCRNPNISIIPISALTGDGFDQWIEWLEEKISEWRKQANHESD